MNILYLDHYAGSIYHGRSFRPYYLGQELIKQGHQLTVVAASYSHLRTKQPSARGWQQIDGINYLWLKTPKYNGNGLRRVVAMIYFICATILKIRTLIKAAKPDVVVASSVYMLDIIPAWLIKKLTPNNCKIIFEVHDLWPDSPLELGNISKFHPFIFTLRAAEYLSYKLADSVISMLPNTLEYMTRFGITKDQWHYIPNGIVTTDWQNPEPLPDDLSALIKQLKTEGKFIVGFAGTISISNALDYLLDAAAILQPHHDIHFILVGDGQERERLQQQVQQLDLSNISFINRISKKTIPTFLEATDALYSGFHLRRIYEYGIGPSKLIDYMMSATPIILALSHPNSIVAKANCGFVVNSENAEAIVGAILALKAMTPTARQHLGDNGRNYAIKHHDYNIIAKQFIKAINS